jgi:hypothetical protein
VRPFAGAGMSFRVYSGVEQERTQLVDGLPATVIIEDPPILENQWSPGFVFSGGVDVGDEAYQIRPEFRYTVWTRNQFQSPVGEFESTQNQFQFEFLISLVF